MISKTFKIFTVSIMAFVTFVSCGEDDPVFMPVPDRDRTEQQLADNDSIENYLKAHYFNSGIFQTQTNLTIDDIVITEMPQDENGNYDEIPPDPANNTRLWDARIEKTTEYEGAEYTYYIINLNQGGGDSPNFTDQVRVIYEGFLVDNEEVFDQVASPADFSMQGIPGVAGTGGVLRGWQLIIPEFNTAENFSVNSGIVEYDNYGLGMMFLPSGLAYFSTAVPNVPVYSNLVFKFQLLQFEVNDHDGDGVPSYIEDENLNLDVLDDDNDEDNIPDFFDLDDDNDDVLTLNELFPSTYTINVGDQDPVLEMNEFEINRSENNGVITIETVRFMDDNNNGVFDHLDSEVTINYNDEDDS